MAGRRQAVHLRRSLPGLAVLLGVLLLGTRAHCRPMPAASRQSAAAASHAVNAAAETAALEDDTFGTLEHAWRSSARALQGAPPPLGWECLKQQTGKPQAANWEALLNCSIRAASSCWIRSNLAGDKSSCLHRAVW